jgi:hypothetical protein
LSLNHVEIFEIIVKFSTVIYFKKRNSSLRRAMLPITGHKNPCAIKTYKNIKKSLL